MEQRALIARFGRDIINYWLRSSEVVLSGLAGGTGLNLQACGPWLQPFFPAAWLEHVLPAVQKLLPVLLQQPWGAPALTPVEKLVAEAPAQLVRLQCRFLQSAIGRDETGQHPPVGSSSGLCTFRPAHGADEPELMPPLAEFRSVTVQTLASLEAFIRASAQQLAAGSILNSITEPAIEAVNGVLFSNGYTEPGPLLSLAAAAGPGSPEQQQLYSLLSSLLKLSVLGVNSSDNILAQVLSRSWISTVQSAIQLLEVVYEFEGPDGSSSTATQHPAGSVISLSEAAAGIPTAPTTDAIALLPSLVLVGRCCVLWAQHLQQAVPQLLRVHAEMGTMPPQQALKYGSFTPSAAAVIALCFPLNQGSANTALQQVVTYVNNWVKVPAVVQQLAPAGHDTQHLPLLCQELLSARTTAAEAWFSDNFVEATAMALVQQLQVTGRALAGLAVPTMCCNPSCSNITGPSDLQLVSGRSCLCGGCRTARYCSRACQKAAWKQHKPVCSALAAAAVSAPGPAAAAAAAATATPPAAVADAAAETAAEPAAETATVA